jgi:hypothetical protein
MRKSYLVLALLGVLFVAGQSQGAILNAGLTAGALNFLNDNDVDRYIPGPGGGAAFAVGDVFESIGIVDNLGGIEIEDAVGVPTYQLSFFSSLTITSVTPAESGTPGLVDIALSGTVSLRETSVASEHVSFAAPNTFATALADHLSQDPLLTLTSDFFQQKDAPSSVSGVPAFPGLIADSGFTVTANPGGADAVPVPFVVDGAPVTYDPINGVFGPTVTTFHDVGIRVQLFTNPGAPISPTEFPLLTDTTAVFRTPADGVIPEAASLFIWAGIIAASGVLAWRKRR